MSLRDLFRPEPPKGPLTCDQCGRFVSVADAVISNEYGDYGSILSSEVECPRCAAVPVSVTAEQEADSA